MQLHWADIWNNKFCSQRVGQIAIWDWSGNVSKELIIFCSIVGFFTLLQSRTAHPFSRAKTAYEFTDRLSWIIGGILTIVIGFWRPWFTTTWWKAILSSIFIFFLISGLSQAFIGSLLKIDLEDKTKTVSRLLAVGIMFAILFFLFRFCGRWLSWHP